MKWNSVRWDINILYWADWSRQGRTKISCTVTTSPTNQPRKDLFHMYSLSPHLPQFQQSAGATPLWFTPPFTYILPQLASTWNGLWRHLHWSPTLSSSIKGLQRCDNRLPNVRWTRMKCIDYCWFCLCNWEGMDVSREYWMIHRGPGFLAVVWFGSSPTPLSPLSRQLYLFLSLHVRCGRTYWRERGGGDGRGAKSYDRKNSWPSVSFNTLLICPKTVRLAKIISIAIR